MKLLKLEVGEDLSVNTAYKDFRVTDAKIISIIYDADTDRIRQVLMIDYSKEVGNGFCTTFACKRTDRVMMADVMFEDMLDTQALYWKEDCFREVC